TRFASLAALAATAAACAAAADREAAFVTRLGDDTVAVERITRTASGLRAEVVVRVPQTWLRVYDVRFDSAGRPATMTVASYDPAAGLAGEPAETREVDLGEGS